MTLLAANRWGREIPSTRQQRGICCHRPVCPGCVPAAWARVSVSGLQSQEGEICPLGQQGANLWTHCARLQGFPYSARHPEEAGAGTQPGPSHAEPAAPLHTRSVALLTGGFGRGWGGQQLGCGAPASLSCVSLPPLLVDDDQRPLLSEARGDGGDHLWNFSFLLSVNPTGLEFWGNDCTEC